MEIKSTGVRMICRSSKHMFFQVDVSKNWQLVALVPQVTNDSQTDVDINYVIMNPMYQHGVMSLKPLRNYTIWSAILKEGIPVEWRGGFKAPEYKGNNESLALEFVKYKIEKSNFFCHSAGSKVSGQLSWEINGGQDDCYISMNSCKTLDSIQPTRAWVSKDNKQNLLFEELPVDEDCELKAKGLYGDANFKYHTNSCDQMNCTSNDHPETPDNISFEMVQNSDNPRVNVYWSPPGCPPDSYNVTLTVNPFRGISRVNTMVLPGNATKAKFYNVTSEENGTYHVEIQAKLGEETAKITKMFDTSGEELDGKRGAVVAGVAGIVVTCVGAAALALLFYCRRLRHRAPVPPRKPWRCSEPEDRWEMRADRLVLYEVIGEGAFGIVHRATLAPQSLQVAVKMLKCFATLDEIRAFHSEMELMKNVGVHPHLVNLVGCCSGSKPFIIVEYCSRGDLLSYLRGTWDVMLASKRNVKHCNNKDSSGYRNDLLTCKAQTESPKVAVSKLYEHQEICDKELTVLDLLSFCRQIAIGMEFLAANRVVHRDLAARNILLTADRTLKIADFGLSRDVYEENQYTQKSNGKMPVKWLSLESLTRAIYTTQSDVWSFGVVVFEIVTVGEAPYAAVPVERLPRLLRSGYRMPKPNNCSPQLYDIMLSCWRTHPHERPNFADLHQRFDELLDSASDNQYLSLEIDADDAPPALALEIVADDAQPPLALEIDADDAPPTLALEIDADDAQPSLALETNADDAPPTLALEIDADDAQPSLALEINADDAPPKLALEIDADDAPPLLALEINADDAPPPLALEIDADDAPPTLGLEIDADDAQPSLALEINADDAPPTLALEIDADDAQPSLALEINADDAPPKLALEIDADDAPPLLALEIDAENAQPPLVLEINADDAQPPLALEIYADDARPPPALEITRL